MPSAKYTKSPPAMNPAQKLQWCMRVLQFCFKLLFRDFQNGGNPFMHKLITYCLTSVIVNYIYIIGFYEKDPFRIMMAIACSSSVVQALVFHLVMHDVLMPIDIIRVIEAIFIANKEPNRKDFALCEQYANWLVLGVKATIGTYVWIVGIIAVSLMVGSYMSGSLRSCLFVYLIGIREYTTELIVLFHAYGYAVLTLVVINIIAGDVLVILTFLSVMFLSVRFEREVLDFNDDLERGDWTASKVRRRLKELVLMHREYKENFQKLNKGFSMNCLTKYATASLILLVGLFAFVKNQDSAAVGLVCAGIFQLGAYCALGTIIEMANNRTYQSVQSINFHLLPPREQRMYLAFSHCVQQPCILFIGGFITLNMQTCVTTITAIYSYAMILYQTV